MFEVVIFWPLDFLCDTCSLSRLKWEGMGGEPDPREREKLQSLTSAQTERLCCFISDSKTAKRK